MRRLVDAAARLPELGIPFPNRSSSCRHARAVQLGSVGIEFDGIRERALPREGSGHRPLRKDCGRFLGGMRHSVDESTDAGRAHFD